jgi:DNA-binding winged helix-turn-helix (wHTH) protein
MSQVYCFEDFELDSDAFELRRAGAAVRIDATVLRLLEFLVQHPGRLVAKEELLAKVWNGRIVSENSLTVAVARLRKVLGDHGGSRESVLTVHGHGYRFSVPVSAREVEAAPVRGVQLANSHFVGRSHVMAQLGAALAQLHVGSGSMLALRGEAGIGKTLVAEVFAEQAARSGCVVAWGSCRELGETPPFWPIVELLRSVIRQASSGWGDAALHAAMPELSWLLPELNTAPATLFELGRKSQVFDVVARMFACVAERSPHVLILDDVQRADVLSIELLQYLLASLARTRVLFVLTLRSGSADPNIAAVLGHRNCVRISVEPLNLAEVGSYVQARCGEVERALCQKVYALSEGNPFYMAELVRQLQGAEQLSADRLTMPRFAVELSSQRLRVLDESTRDVLTYAAVLGKVFSLPLLAAVTEQSPAALMVVLDRACSAEIVRSLAHSGTDFSFTHSLLRAALYDAQSAAERRARHLRVTQTLEQRLAFAELSCTDLADHALAALPEGDLRKTVDYCMKAAGAAESTCAFADAMRYLKYAREALDLVEGGSTRLRFQLLFRQALLARAHSAHEFLPLAEQLLRLAREQGAIPLAAASLLLDPFPGFPRLPVMRGVLADALAGLPAAAPSLRPALMARLASSVPLAYSAAASYAQIERALVLADNSPERGDHFSAHFGALYLYGGPAHPTRAATALTALERMCNEDKPLDPLPITLLELHRALSAAQHGNLAAMARALERCEQRFREVEGDGEMRWHLERLRALLQINLGHAPDGRAALLALHRRSHCCSGRAGTAVFCVYDQNVVLSPCELSVSSTLVCAPDADDPPNIWALKLRALAAAGSLAEAQSALELLPAERLADLPCDREFLGTMGALARAALRLNARAYIACLYECLLPFPQYFAVSLTGHCEGSVSLLLGLLARSGGNVRRAKQHFADAVTHSERAGLSVCVDEALLELARCSDVIGRRSAAAPP